MRMRDDPAARGLDWERKFFLPFFPALASCRPSLRSGAGMSVSGARIFVFSIDATMLWLQVRFEDGDATPS